MIEYIFVTGGMVSSIGKGTVAASSGRLLRNRGLKVTIQEFDLYINVNPGTMSPYQHGEVLVTDNDAETDLDLSHYERFIGINLNKYSGVTAGKIYSEVLRRERKEEYLDAAVQVIPHIINEVKEKIICVAEVTDASVIITEVGGTVSDIESLPFLEALHRMKADMGSSNVMYIHTILIPYLKAVSETKTKLTQHSVRELRSLGIQPDILAVRAESPVSQNTRNKLVQFYDVNPEAVAESRDAEILYSIPLAPQTQNMDQIVCDHLKLDAPVADMAEQHALEERVLSLKKKTKIAPVGKYVELPDAYISVVEALKYVGLGFDSDTEIDWVDSQKLAAENVVERIGSTGGILIPGGFDDCGIERKIEAIRFARESDVPFLDICLGMQTVCVELDRSVVGLEDTGSAETNPNVTNNIIGLVADQENIGNLGGTLRLDSHLCKLKKGTKTAVAYRDEDVVQKRHRHRCELNNKYRQLFEENDLVLSRVSPDNRLVEIVEIPGKQFFVACQFHPELTSRPSRPQRLIKGFVGAALVNKESKQVKMGEVV